MLAASSIQFAFSAQSVNLADEVTRILILSPLTEVLLRRQPFGFKLARVRPDK